MPRFVMANRLSGVRGAVDEEAPVRALNTVFRAGASSVRTQRSSAGRQVITFDHDPAEIEAKLPLLRHGIIVEPLIRHSARLPFIDAALSATAGPPAESTASYRVTVGSDGKPVEGANVVLIATGSDGDPVYGAAKTDAKGSCDIAYDASATPSQVYVLPLAGRWSMLVAAGASPMSVETPALPTAGPLGWWHRLARIDELRLDRGRGIRIGVIDTGFGPSPLLRNVVDAGAFVNGVSSSNGADVSSHGTGTCGLIAAVPVVPGDYAGIAPGSTVYSMRIFDPPGISTNQGDMALAIDELSTKYEADLINISIFSQSPSAIEHDAVQAALARGTLCICSAGNIPGPVCWPAAFPESVSVSALALNGWAPEQTVASTMIDYERAGGEGLFLASISAFGPNLSVGAPGVGIIACVPSSDGTSAFIDDSGTSLAAPIVTGTLAALLATDEAYPTLPRNAARAGHARSVMQAAAQLHGFPRDYVGGGIPAAG